MGLDETRLSHAVLLVAAPPGQVQFFVEGHMPGPVVCSVCDKSEEHCECERYCSICQGQHAIRLCIDGQYYCPDCREACDIRPVDSRDR